MLSKNQSAELLLGPPFKNRYTERATGKGLLKWQWARLKARIAGKARLTSAAVSTVAPNLELLKAPLEAPRFTWIGHATLLVQMGGLNILTDPHFGDFASPIRGFGPKRQQAPGVPLNSLPPIDYVLLSHNHYDHLDRASIQSLWQLFKPTFLVPLGVEAWFWRHLGPSEEVKARVHALAWPESYQDNRSPSACRFQFLPVQHWSGRSLRDHYATLWGSWAILTPTCKFWFAGDLAYSPDIRDIYQEIGSVDVAAIPIGGYAPRWFMQSAHIDPREAVQIFAELEVKSAIGIHWGTFGGLSDEPLDEPPRYLQAVLTEKQIPLQRFQLLQPGETRIWQAEQLQFAGAKC